MQLVSIGYGFGVRASADDVMSFASTWPGAGFPDKGFTAYFDAKPDPDLVDLSGWAADPDGDFDGYGLSALIDDMKEWGQTRIADAIGKSPSRRTKVEKEVIKDLGAVWDRQLRSNPAGRKIRSKAQWRKLAAMMERGEISKKDFDDMVGESKPFKRLPARAPSKGRKSRRRKPRRRKSRKRNPPEIEGINKLQWKLLRKLARGYKGQYGYGAASLPASRDVPRYMIQLERWGLIRIAKAIAYKNYGRSAGAAQWAITLSRKGEAFMDVPHNAPDAPSADSFSAWRQP